MNNTVIEKDGESVMSLEFTPQKRTCTEFVSELTRLPGHFMVAIQRTPRSTTHPPATLFYNNHVMLGWI